MTQRNTLILNKHNVYSHYYGTFIKKSVFLCLILLYFIPSAYAWEALYRWHSRVLKHFKNNDILSHSIRLKKVICVFQICNNDSIFVSGRLAKIYDFYPSESSSSWPLSPGNVDRSTSSSPITHRCRSSLLLQRFLSDVSELSGGIIIYRGIS